MKTIAVYCEGGVLAHATRALEVGRALARGYGYRVVFCCCGEYVHVMRDAGFEVKPVFTVDFAITARVAKSGRPPPLGWWTDVCDQAVASELETFADVKPDAVVGDMRWTLSTSARAARIPYVSVTNAYWTDRYTGTIDLPEGHVARRVLGDVLAEALFPTMLRASMAYGALGFRRARRKHGLPRMRSMWEAVEGDVTLLADLPELMPVRPDTPPRFRYVGPVLWRPDLPAPDWLATLDPGRPTVYFTMGSTGDARFFEEAVRLFGGTDVQVLMTTAGLAELPATPPNVFAARYAPGDALMAVSDVVVSHGGNGTLYQALARGVPVIGLPTIVDQEINMRRVTEMGLGLALSSRRSSGEALVAAVRTVLGDPSYRERCRALAPRVAAADGPGHAAAHIDHFVEHGDPLRTP